MKGIKRTSRRLLSLFVSFAIAASIFTGLVPGMSLTAYATEQSVTFTAPGTQNGITVSADIFTYNAFFVNNKNKSVYISSSGGPITRIVLTDANLYSNHWNSSYLSASAGTVSFDGSTMTVTDINATSVNIIGTNKYYGTISSIVVYYENTHTHSFTYSASGATITATCGEGCDITEGLTLTISAPTGDLTADGTKTFPATLSTGYNTTAFPGTYTITYTKNGAEFTGTPTEAGEYTASVTVGTATASVSYTVNASKDTQTITATDVTATYGDTGVKINASTTGDGGLSYAVKSGDAVTVDSSGNLTIVKAGTAVITVTAAETDTYAQATKDVTVTINTKDMTVSAEDVNVTVDGQPHGITVNVTDPASGATVKYGTEEGTYNLDASPTQTEVGETTVYYQVTADNYTTYTGSAKVTVSAKQTQTITASDVTATYGDTGVKINASTTGDGGLSYAVKSGDAVTVDSSGNLTIVKAGTAVITVTAAETDTYAQATKDVTVTINTKDMTVSAEDVNVTVDGQPHGITVNVTDPATGYTVKYGTTEGSYTLDASPTQTEVGETTVYYQVTADNYTTYTGSAKVTVSAKQTQTITASDVTATYGDTGVTINASVTTGGGALSYSVKSGDAVTVDSSGNLTIVKAGTAVITVTAAETDTYAQATKDVTVTINTKDMTVSAEDVNVTVDGQPHGITVNVTDPATGYTVKYGTTEGSYTLDTSPTQTETGETTVYYQVTADNYTTYTGSAKVTVSAKQTQTITASDVTATYGDTGVKINASTTGDGGLSYAVKSGDAVTVDSSGNLTIVKAGTAVITVTAAETDTYAQATKDVTVTINTKDMTVSAEDVNVTVDGQPHGITVNVTDPATGYTVKYGTTEGSYTLDASPTQTEVGETTVYYQVTADNYTTYTGSAKVTVSAKQTQTITASDVTATYGDTGVTINASVTTGGGALSYSVKSGDAVTVDSSGNLTIVKAGTAVITVTAAETDTYAQATKDVTVTINTKDMTVSAEDVNVTVDGQPHGITVNVTDPATGYTVKYGTTEGSYTLDTSPTQTETGETTVYYQVTADNYTTYTGSAKVTVSAKQTQTITASDVTATYGDTGVKINASTTGDGGLSYAVKSGDAVTVDSSGNLTIVKAGTAVITVTAAETDTYAQATKDVTVTINTKDMTVSAEDVNVTVDGQPHGITVNVTDPASGATVKYGTEEGTYNLDASPTQTEVGETTVYYQVTADNYTTYTGSAKVTVSAKQTQTITASDVTATYGDTGVKINASTTGDGGLSYAVKSGDAVTVDSSGNLTIVKAGTAVITVTAAETDTYAQATKDVTVTINTKDMTVSAEDVNVTVDGQPHGITVNVTDPATGYTVKYGTTEGSYTLDASPTQTEVGETTVYYQVTADNYTTYTGSAKVTVSAKQTQTITASDVTATYGDTGVTINASVTTGGGALSYSVKSGDAVTVDSSGNLTIVKAGTAVITVTAAETDTYAQATKDVTVTINTKDMTVSAEDVNVTVDGQPHGITVNVTDPATGYTVKYGTTEGSYTLDTSPTQTETGETTVYYQVTADNYTTYTGSAKVTVSAKQTQTITASDVTATYGDTGVKINASTTGDGGLSYAVKSGDAVTVDSSGNLTIVKAGTAVITVTAAETATYAQATKDVTVNISKADIDADSIDVSIESWVAGEDTNTPVITGLPAGVSADNVIIMYAPEGSDQFTTDMPSTAGNYVVKVVVPESDNYKEATFTASLTIEPVVYSFIGDDGLSWIKGSSETLSFTAKRNVSDDKTFGKFTGILVDGVEVSANNYTAVSGSVVVTLSADYLNTLSVGEHTITIRFSDGADITTRFTVKASGIASPATGETISIWTLMGFACIAAAGAVISFKRWKKEEE